MYKRTTNSTLGVWDYTLNLDKNTFTKELKGLHAFTQYEIIVCGKTSAGRGNCSDWKGVLCVTKEGCK